MNISKCIMLSNWDVIEIMNKTHDLNLEDLNDYIDINGLYDCAILLNPLDLDLFKSHEENNKTDTLIYTLSKYILDEIGKNLYSQIDYIVIEF